MARRIVNTVKVYCPRQARVTAEFEKPTDRRTTRDVSDCCVVSIGEST